LQSFPPVTPSRDLHLPLFNRDCKPDR
jgi:hypothetical protein